jgi:DNA excision repair protein ERCC-6
MEQWVREIRAWWPPTRAVIFHSSGNSNVSLKKLLRSLQAGSVLITTYAAMRSEQARLSAKRWSAIVLDEGHKIRNPDAGVTLAAKSFDCSRRFILSGAPIQNNLGELWSLVDFVMPGRLGTLPVFKMEFEAPIRAGGFANASLFQVQTAYKCAVALRDAVRPYLLRRVKKDVLKDLPRKTEQVLFCRLTDEQHQMYVSFLSTSVVHDVSSSGRMYVHKADAYGTSHRDQIQGLRGGGRIVSQGVGRASSGRSSGTGTNGSSMFMAIDHLRKLCNHPDLVTDATNLSEGQTYGDWRRSGKLRVLDELLRIWHREGHKCLVFCQTRQMLDIVEAFVSNSGYNHLRMDGNTKIGSRQLLIDRFNKDSDVFVFVLTARVGGLGTNLVGANRLVILDPDWNPSTDMQARERAWRIGQQRNVVIYRLMTAGTIEEKIYHRQIFKQSMTNRILVDPQQRRFLQSAQLGDLFTVPPAPSDGSAQQGRMPSGGRAQTETGHLFASLDSEILPQHVAHVATRDLEAEEAAELDSQREAGLRVDADEGDEDGDDCRVLQALFQCAKLRSVVRHDAIEGDSSRAAVAMEQAANQVADVEVQRRLAALERSRTQVSGNSVSAPTWTGRSGAAGAPPPPRSASPPPRQRSQPQPQSQEPTRRPAPPPPRPPAPPPPSSAPAPAPATSIFPAASALFAPPPRKRTGSVAARRAAQAAMLDDLAAAHAEPELDELDEDPDFVRAGGSQARPAASNVFAGPTIDLTGSDNDDADAPTATVAPAGAPSLPRSAATVFVTEVTVAQYFRQADPGTGLSTAQVAAHFGAKSVAEARTLRNALRAVATFDDRTKRWKLQ